LEHVSAAAFHPSRPEIVLFGGNTGTYGVFDVSDLEHPKVLSEFKGWNSIELFRWNATGTIFATVWETALRMHTFTDTRAVELNTIQLSHVNILDALFVHVAQPSWQLGGIVVSTSDSNVQLYDVKTTEVRASLEHGTGKITSLAFGPDFGGSQTVLGAGEDVFIK
jgi:WD40 repeat protein